MVKPKTDRRRKRSPSAPSPSPSERASPRETMTLMLAAALIVSILSSTSISDDAAVPPPSSSSSSSPPRPGRRQLRSEGPGGDDATAATTTADREQRLRRFLAADDSGGGENVWRRQLRARKDQGRELGYAGGGDYRMDGMTDEGVPMPIDEGGQLLRRMSIIPRYADKHHFEECVGKSLAQCQVLIDTYVTANSEDFNNQTTLWMDVRKIRELTDDSYYKVVLRTNLPGTKVYGIFDDGMVYYPWPWRVAGEDLVIGPWSCEDSGNILSPEECCTLIQDNVTDMDDFGHYLACFVEEPVGGPHNPEREDRVIVVTDGFGKVLRAPVAH